MAAIVLLPQPDTPITTATEGSAVGGSACMGAPRVRRTIDEPHQLTRRSCPARRQVLAREHARQDVALVFALDEEQHLAAGRERGKRQRDAWDERLQAGVIDAHCPTLLFEQCRSIRKQ